MNAIHDLRSALTALESAGSRVATIDAPIDPRLSLIDDYLRSYRTETNSWMTAEQPLRLYRRPMVGAFPVLMGVFGSRERVRFLLDPNGERGDLSNGRLLLRARENSLAPRRLAAPTARIAHHGADLSTWLPALTHSDGDPGPTITLGLVYARDARTGAANCSVHRITLKRSSVVMGVNPTGHLQRMIDQHAARGERLSVSINIGLDPAIYMASALSRPAVDFGEDELAVAGGLRGEPVQLAPCLSGAGHFIDHAEIVIEGSLGTETEIEADLAPGEAGERRTMPEYLGYSSPVGAVAALRVSGASHRPGAIYQAVSGPGREQSELLGLGQETAIWRVLQPLDQSGLIRDVVAAPAGGGHLLTILRTAKRASADDAAIRTLADRILRDVPTTKSIFLVDEDVNPTSADDIFWAMATRFRAENDLVVTQDLPGTPLDPTQARAYSGRGEDGFTPKNLFDCTAPFDQRARFRRAFS